LSLHILSFQGLPNVRDYQINAAILEHYPDIRISVLAETPGYYDKFERLGHPFVKPPRYWRTKPKSLWGKLRYHFMDTTGTGPDSAGGKLARIVDELDVDVIHTHNLNHLGYFALRYTDRPVIHDVSDFYSIFPRHQGQHRSLMTRLWQAYRHRQLLRWEAYIFGHAAGLTFQSPHYIGIARGRYTFECPTAVVPNAVLAADVPATSLPKLSSRDGRLHTVFVGHINGPKLERLEEVADLNIAVHLYTFQETEFEPQLAAACEGHPHLYHHGTLPRRQLLHALTQYDFGLILWYEGATERFFEAVLPSKMFYYLASGLPIIVAPHHSLIEFVCQHECGFVLRSPDELHDKVKQSYSVGDRNLYTVEHYLPQLVELYRSVATRAEG
jgi:hypothetical protein